MMTSQALYVRPRDVSRILSLTKLPWSRPWPLLKDVHVMMKVSPKPGREDKDVITVKANMETIGPELMPELTGHFPLNPILPAVTILEALGQSAAFGSTALRLDLLDSDASISRSPWNEFADESSSSILLWEGIKMAKFFQPIRHDTALSITTSGEAHSGVWRARAEVLQGDPSLIAEAQFTLKSHHECSRPETERGP